MDFQNERGLDRLRTKEIQSKPCGKGLNTERGVDFKEVFSSVVRHASIRVLCHQ